MKKPIILLSLLLGIAFASSSVINHASFEDTPSLITRASLVQVNDFNLEDNQQHKNDTIELGKVAWMRDYNAAIRLAKKQNKPMFILFQEVPGCLNCKRFGREVMSNPLVVDVIENEFIPLCIFNNKKGKDVVILRKFSEPSWNNPVVRIINSKGKDITRRMGSFHPREVVNGIAQAMANSHQKTPQYFRLLQQQINAQYSKVEEAVFPMYCFWSGELKLGQIKGVTNTTPGFMNGKEVVKVTFDANKTSYQNLIKNAQHLQAIEGAFVEGKSQQKIAQKLFPKQGIRSIGRFRLDREPKYYMFQTKYKHVPMLPLQRIQVNRALFRHQNPHQYLSPSQIKLYKKITQKNIKLADYSLSDNLVNDWEKVQKQVN